MWPLPAITPNAKIGLATSTLVHVGLVVAGLAMTAPYVAPHFHMHRGAIEIQGSFAAAEVLETTVAVELPAEPDRRPLEIVPPLAPAAVEVTDRKDSAEPRPLPASSLKMLTELAVCDCPDGLHQVETPKRRTNERLLAVAAQEPAPRLPRADNVAQVSASQIASVPAASEPAGTQADKPPKVIATNRPPPYPGDAYQRGLEGRVLLEVRVSPQGTVESLRVVESSGTASLDRSALETVRSWRFEPGRRDGRAVEALMNVPVRFRIRTN